jgi:AGZA family xanthine/uracil permease-like MFS transporter
VGIGLITALAGVIELELVKPGRFTILQQGPVTSDIIIAMAATVLIALAMHYHIKGSFMYGLIFGTLFHWWLKGDWPSTVGAFPGLDSEPFELMYNSKVISLFLSLTFLYIVTGDGIARSLSDQAGLTIKDTQVPRTNMIYIVCGLTTILSGFLSGPPILISPESASGIKAGARTGLSTIVCGLLFAVSLLFCPLFENVPPSGTTPLLILVGMILFTNTSRVDWAAPRQAVPAFFVIILIPFNYSIISGVGFGWALYVAISIFTGNFGDVTACFSVFQQMHAHTPVPVLDTRRPTGWNHRTAVDVNRDSEDEEGGTLATHHLLDENMAVATVPEREQIRKAS